MMAGATVEYEASPTPTRARNTRKAGKDFIKDPISVDKLQNPEQTHTTYLKLEVN